VSLAVVTITILAAAANAVAAGLDFARARQVLVNMDRVGVPRSWLLPLGALKAAGAAGLLVGLGVPLIGIAAGAGLSLFFIGAVAAHARARLEPLSYSYPGAFLLLALGALVPRLAAL
jgi:hypothetical protein